MPYFLAYKAISPSYYSLILGCDYIITVANYIIIGTDFIIAGTDYRIVAGKIQKEWVLIQINVRSLVFFTMYS